jgi:antitoxin (DNA-binding transcriptional repressor) of toxin-antitoxin stability system
MQVRKDRRAAMRQIDIERVQADLLGCLEQVAPGEAIVVCKNNLPVAEIRRLPQPRQGARPLGLAKGMGEIHPTFFEPLPEDILDAFEGKRP